MSSVQYFWFVLLLLTIKYSKPCVDVVFVLDGSGSVKQHFQQMINMASDVAKQFDIDKRGHRIAILEFSSKAIISKWLRYPFDQFKTNSDVEKVIQNLPHIRGITDMGEALDVVLQEFLPQHRSGTPFLVFIITDGYYRDSEEVQQNVASLVDKPNVQLFVATASKPYNMRGLLVLVDNDSSHIVTNTNFPNISRKILKPYSECFGSKTDFTWKKVTLSPTATNNTFTTLSFATAATEHRINRKVKLSQNLEPESETLPEFVFRQVRFAGTPPFKPVHAATQSLVSTTTTKSIPTKLNIKPECLLDVIFLMDFSGGTSDKRDIYIDFASILIRSLDLGRTPAHVAAIYYSGPKRAHTLFHFRKHITSEGAIKDLHQAPSNGGTTRTGEAIYYAINEFNEKFGARKGARKMMIIFTDGYSQDNPIKASQLAHSKGIELKALSVEDESVPPDTEQIIAITGDPSDTYSTKDFKKLQSLFDEYSRRCKL
uniref:VWFA domain-containing protein n=1 Tax=Onchocerca volvulus TaxID=6282 RepID=A0A8R1TW17_ONCVO